MVMMLPGDTWALRLVQGQDYAARFRLRTDGEWQSMTGYVPQAQIRPEPGGTLMLDLAPYLSIGHGPAPARYQTSPSSPEESDFVLLDIPGGIIRNLTSNGRWDLYLVDEVAPLTEPGIQLARGPVVLTKAVTSVG